MKAGAEFLAGPSAALMESREHPELTQGCPGRAAAQPELPQPCSRAGIPQESTALLWERGRLSIPPPRGQHPTESSTDRTYTSQTNMPGQPDSWKCHIQQHEEMSFESEDENSEELN